MESTDTDNSTPVTGKRAFHASDELSRMIEELSALCAEAPVRGTAEEKARKIRIRNKIRELTPLFYDEQKPFFLLRVYTTARDMELTHDCYLFKQYSVLNKVLKHVRRMRTSGVSSIEVVVSYSGTADTPNEPLAVIFSADPECIVHFDDADYACATLTADFNQDQADIDNYLDWIIDEIDEFDQRAKNQDPPSNQNDVVEWMQIEHKEMTRICKKELGIIKKRATNAPESKKMPIIVDTWVDKQSDGSTRLIFCNETGETNAEIDWLLSGCDRIDMLGYCCRELFIDIVTTPFNDNEIARHVKRFERHDKSVNHAFINAALANCWKWRKFGKQNDYQELTNNGTRQVRSIIVPEIQRFAVATVSK
jgi:hypothetical protein